MNILYPQSVAEAADMVRRTAKEGLGIFPAGTLTRLEGALDLKRDGPTLISCAQLKKIDSIEPDNLLLIAEAGLTPDEIDEALKPTGLYWPVTGLGRRTLGAIMAEGALGVETMARGTMCDWVLGASFVTIEGKLVASGGRTLKNVAGYDYTRLIWRSFGRLGLCVRFILKLIPRPPLNPVLEIRTPDAAQAAALANDIIVSKMNVEGLRIVYSPDKSSLLVWLAGFPEVVAAKREQIEALTNEPITIHNDGQAFWREHAQNWQPADPAVAPLMGARKALLATAEIFAAKRAALSADLDLGGGRAYFRMEEGVTGDGLAKTFGLTFDRFSPNNEIYARLKKALDPRGLFFPGTVNK